MNRSREVLSERIRRAHRRQGKSGRELAALSGNDERGELPVYGGIRAAYTLPDH
ncbi:hypothetical protein [Streptacidiphilus sp. MAP5-3]|uniref:hypothetical protein n=1 Tax=unclassified Streptacidiphilus TaxID=2643834 RepID=UPI0035180267